MKRDRSDFVLKDFKLRSTPTRQDVLKIFLSVDHALSHSDIEREISESYDRVTLYRTLKTFLDNGLIHKVLDDEGASKYALCKEACNSSKHHHDHVHFKCNNCGQTSCLEVEIPSVRLPKGFNARAVNLLVQGICNLCGHEPKNPERKMENPAIKSGM
jgi:Fur family transcriptional regulator, ferric uptake regulator